MRKLGAGRIIASIILIIVALGIGIVPSKLLLGGNDGGGSVAGAVCVDFRCAGRAADTEIGAVREFPKP